MNEPAPVPPPPGLGAAGRQFWRGLADRFDLESHEQRLLPEQPGAWSCSTPCKPTSTRWGRRSRVRRASRRIRASSRPASSVSCWLAWWRRSASLSTTRRMPSQHGSPLAGLVASTGFVVRRESTPPGCRGSSCRRHPRRTAARPAHRTVGRRAASGVVGPRAMVAEDSGCHGTSQLDDGQGRLPGLDRSAVAETNRHHPR